MGVDGNGNGLPDSWEQTAFGNLTETAGGDFDLDGVSNLDEFLDGTSPTSDTSVRPRLTLFADGGRITVSPAQTSYSYGQSVSLTAEPGLNSLFSQWSGAVAGTTNPVNLTLNGSKTVTATFINKWVRQWGRQDSGWTRVPVDLSGVTGIDAGNEHTVAVTRYGQVAAWGSNLYRQCDAPSNLNNVVAVAGGMRFTLALKADGTLAGWGSNLNGELLFPPEATDLVAIDAGPFHGVGLRRDGTVVAWGGNVHGESTVPPGLNNVVAVAAGGFGTTGDHHTLALRADGTVVAWGSNEQGQCSVPTGLNGVVAIAAGEQHSVSLKSDGTVVIWGYAGSNPPTGLTNAVRIAAGGGTTFAVTADGTLVGGGNDSYGETTPPADLSKALLITAGSDHAAAVVGTNPEDARPDIVGGPWALGALNSGFHHRVLAKNGPTSFGVTGLPAGLSINGTTGVISGVPVQSGTFMAIVSTSNAAGTAEAPLAITINLPVPGISSSRTAIAYAGNTFSYQMTAANGASSYTATGLPAGLSLNPESGLISGIPATLGVFPVQLTAINGHGVGSGELILTVRTIAAWGANDYQQTTVPDGLNDVIGLAAGYYHSLALRSNGTVLGWGDNGFGRAAPPAGLIGVIAVAAGMYHSLALKQDGTVVAWGSSSGGRTSVPAGLTGVAAIEAADAYSLALKSDGTVVAWGSSTMEPPPGLNNVVAISAGNTHALALRADGTVTAWGSNFYGEATVPTGLSGVVAIAAGYSHSLALKADGTVVAWGDNSYGQTGVPALLANVSSIVAGRNFSIALKIDGNVVAWGNNESGATLLPGVLDHMLAIATSANARHSFALPSNNPSALTPRFIGVPVSLGAVGSGFRHQARFMNAGGLFSATGLPPGLTIDPVTGLITGIPTSGGTYDVVISATNGSGTSTANLKVVFNLPIPGILSSRSATGYPGVAFNYQTTVLNGATSYAATGLPAGLSINPTTGLISGVPNAAGSFSVILSATNAHGTGDAVIVINLHTIVAWGSNSLGQTDVPATAMSPITQVAAAGDRSFALKADGSVVGWGGSYALGSTPSGLVAIDCGFDHAIGLKADGTVAAWGNDSYGKATVPAGLTNVAAISTISSHNLALKSDGTVVGWGSNNDGVSTPPSGLDLVVGIAAGERHSVALRGDGTVVAWGYNGNGQTSVPAGLNNVVAIASGYYHVLALKADGTVVAWGMNNQGQATVPPGLTNVVGISAGSYHSVALKSDGTIVCWGGSSSGQLIPPPEIASAIALDAGGDHSLALVSADPTAPLPAIINSSFGIGVLGYPFQLRLAAKNLPTVFAVTGLPPGLTLAPATGVISGTPTSAGTFILDVAATNVAGTFQKTVSLTINAAVSQITSSLTAFVPAGESFTYQITATNNPISFAATGLPSGLTVNTSSGVISGSTNVLGSYNVILQVNNASGSRTATLALEVGPSLAEALDATGRTWSTSGTVPWRGQTATTFDGVDAAQSAPITHNGASWMQTQIQGPATVSFKWKVSSESGWDYLRFRVNGTELKRISGTGAAWASESFNVAAGSQTLEWLYTKDSSGTSGEDRGWVDQVVIVAAPTITSAAVVQLAPGEVLAYQITADQTVTSYAAAGLPAGITINTSTGLISGSTTTTGNYAVTLSATSGGGTGVASLNIVVALPLGDALDLPGSIWNLGGNGFWYNQSSVTHDGVDAAQSGVITHSQQTWMETTVTGPGTVTFYWKVSSESGYDFLCFLLGGVETKKISGAAGTWLAETFNVSAGSQTLRWSYTKDGSASSGADAAWVDEISYTQILHPIITSSLSAVALSGAAYSYQVQAINTPTSFAAVGLPAGLSINTTTGQITGSTTASGAYPVTLQATNAYGTGTATLNLTVAIPLPEALEATLMTWATGGDASWYGHFAESFDGVDSATSGSLSDSQASWMEGTITGPAYLSFKWKVSSAYGDTLNFLFNDVSQGFLEGSSGGWETFFLRIPAGTHVLRWEYAKDGSFATGQDRGWVDNIQLLPDPLVTWRELYWPGNPTAPEAAHDADPDHDGLKNLLEYALGGNPLTHSAAKNPTVSMQIDEFFGWPVLIFQFDRMRADLRYETEVSDDLSSWTTYWVNPGAVGTRVSAGVYPWDGHFVRLKVSLD